MTSGVLFSQAGQVIFAPGIVNRQKDPENVPQAAWKRLPTGDAATEATWEGEWTVRNPGAKSVQSGAI
jgi:hypothetical protein